MVSHNGVQSCLLLLLLAVVLAGTESNIVRSSGGNDWTRERLVEKFYRGNLQALSALLSQPQMPERYLTGRESFYANLKARNRVLDFSWNNCGSGTDPVLIHNLNLSPDPIKLPGDVQLTFDVSVNTNITAPFQVDLDVKKKVSFFWVDIPCVDHMGSCNYGDVCSMLRPDCPPAFHEHGIPCTCPFPQGEYNLPQSTITVPDLHMPSFLTTGDYRVTVDGKDQGGNRLFCIHLQFSMD